MLYYKGVKKFDGVVRLLFSLAQTEMGVIEMQAEWWRTDGQRLETENKKLQEENNRMVCVDMENKVLRKMIHKLGRENTKLKQQLKKTVSRKCVPDINGWTLVTRK